MKQTIRITSARSKKKSFVKKKKSGKERKIRILATPQYTQSRKQTNTHKNPFI